MGLLAKLKLGARTTAPKVQPVRTAAKETQAATTTGRTAAQTRAILTTRDLHVDPHVDGGRPYVSFEGGRLYLSDDEVVARLKHAQGQKELRELGSLGAG